MDKTVSPSSLWVHIRWKRMDHLIPSLPCSSVGIPVISRGRRVKPRPARGRGNRRRIIDSLQAESENDTSYPAVAVPQNAVPSILPRYHGFIQLESPKSTSRSRAYHETKRREIKESRPFTKSFLLASAYSLDQFLLLSTIWAKGGCWLDRIDLSNLKSRDPWTLLFLFEQPNTWSGIILAADNGGDQRERDIIVVDWMDSSFCSFVFPLHEYLDHINKTLTNLLPSDNHQRQFLFSTPSTTNWLNEALSRYYYWTWIFPRYGRVMLFVFIQLIIEVINNIINNNTVEIIVCGFELTWTTDKMFDLGRLTGSEFP